MDPQRAERIDEIFQSALDVPAEQRSAFLDEACAADIELRHEVESLLSAHDRARSFIERPASEVATEVLPDAENLAGRYIGGYKVVSVLDRGGMGEVYLAEDPRLGRKVALKMLAASMTGDEERVRRFRREAETVSALNHPNILTLYEVGRWRGRDFIATEFVEGATLRMHMRGKALPIAASIDVALQLASALDAAHGAGIVHRDIKPENIMVRPDGLVKVLDFGIAKYAQGAAPARRPDRNEAETVSGAVVGTINYMSPEQTRGLAVDTRTDLWSLGVILFEMLTGQLPFRGNTPSDRMAAVLERAPESLSRLRPGVPPELEHIVGRALAKDRDQRYSRAADVAEDLGKLRVTLGDESPFRFGVPAARGLRSSFRQHSWMMIAGLLLVLAAVIGPRLLYSHSTGLVRIESLAVLPLVNVAGSNDTEYLSDGITESLIDSLSQLPDLKVMSRSSVFRYKGQEIDARKVGDALRVQGVLTGRVLQRGDNLTINVELVDARDGSIVWGEQYTRTFTDLVTLQNELTREISRKLRLRISGAGEQRLAKNSVVDPEAYRDYLKGRYHILKATRPEIETGISSLRHAIDVDPSYALAHAGLADAYRVLALAGESPASDELPKAKAAAKKALEIDDGLAEAHAMLGFVIFWYDWKWNDAESEFKRALELDPNSAIAHEAYANLLSYTRRHAEGLAEIRRAADLDPLNLRIGALEGALLVNAGRPDEALAKLAKTLELEPDYWFARLYVASALIDKRMFSEAIAEARKAKQLSDASTRPAAFLGYALAQAGRPAEAHGELDALLKLSTERYVSPYNVAMIYHGLGQRAEALAWLERGYREREPRMVFLDSEPKWSGLRGDPRFEGLLRRIGFVK